MPGKWSFQLRDYTKCYIAELIVCYNLDKSPVKIEFLQGFSFLTLIGFRLFISQITGE